MIERYKKINSDFEKFMREFDIRLKDTNHSMETEVSYSFTH